MPDLIACPDPTCRAPARIVDRWTFGSTDGRSSTSRPAASAATGSRRRSTRSDPAPTTAEPSPIPVSVP